MKPILLVLSIILFFITVTHFAFAEDDELKSLREERIEILKYGIDSEVTEVIMSLISEKDENFKEEVYQVFHDSISPALRKAAFNYFKEIKWDGAIEDAKEIIAYYDEEREEVVLLAISYLAEHGDDESIDLLLELIDFEEEVLSNAAINALGKTGNPQVAESFLEHLEDTRYPTTLKPALIRALGNLEYTGAVEALTDILLDDDEEKSWRWYACVALGNIGAPESLPALEQAFGDQDTILRSHAVSALKDFSGSRVDDLIIQSLRDSFWRVRVQAAGAIAERNLRSAVPNLIYKVSRDPDKPVRSASIEALGKLGGKESFDFLREFFKGERNPADLRLSSLKALVEHDLSASLEIIEVIIAEEWEKDRSLILDHTCAQLAGAENPRLEDLFAKFLDHKSVTIKIYGLRGIEKNNFRELRSRVEELTEEGIHRSVRKVALSVLESL